MSDPWAERHPRLGGLRGVDREQVQSHAEGYNAALAAIRPLYDAAVARAEAWKHDAERLSDVLLRLANTPVVADPEHYTIDEWRSDVEVVADTLAAHDAERLAAALGYDSEFEIDWGDSTALSAHDALVAEQEEGT